MVETIGIIKGTPTEDPDLPRRLADFDTLVEALDYAAKGQRGLNFYSARGELISILTYSELRERAVSFGRLLVGLGMRKGARLALIADTSAEFAVQFLGCQYASVLPVPLPLPTSFGGRESYISQLRTQLKSCRADMMLAPQPMIELARQACEGMDLQFAGTANEFDELDIVEGEVRLPEANDPAYLQYSSGSTRFPHGISITHRALMSNCRGQGKHGVQLVDDDRCISWLPFYHDMGLVGTFLTPITCQVSVDYLSTEDFARRPMTWLMMMTANRGTISYSPTFGYDICARRAGAEAISKLDLSPWRVAGIGGDMIRPEVIRRFAKTFASAGFAETTFVASYGLAECTLAVSFAPLGRGIEIDLVEEHVLTGDKPRNGHAFHKDANGHRFNGLNGHDRTDATNGREPAIRMSAEEPGPTGNGRDGTRMREVVNCGIPLPEYEIEIRDEDGRVVAERDVGRVFVRGRSVMTEYFEDPESTRAVLCGDGWLDTGDMGYSVGDSLYIVGRAKDLIIVNGRNHWPQDIEWAAEQLPEIRSGDIAAISIPGNNSEEIPTVLVQCRLRDPRERSNFAQRVKQKILQSTGVSCQIEMIPPRSLPRTSSGKLSRVKARTQFLTGGISALAS